MTKRSVVRTSHQMQQLIQITCPYCGAPTDVHVESSDGNCIEDCTVCCQPIELVVRVDANGTARVEAHRGDE